MATTPSPWVKEGTDMLRDIMVVMNGHDVELIRLVLAMAFAEVLRRSKMELPIALDAFTLDAAEFYSRPSQKDAN